MRAAGLRGVVKVGIGSPGLVCNSLSAFVDRQKQRPTDRDVDIGEGGWWSAPSRGREKKERSPSQEKVEPRHRNIV